VTYCSSGNCKTKCFFEHPTCTAYLFDDISCTCKVFDQNLEEDDLTKRTGWTYGHLTVNSKELVIISQFFWSKYSLINHHENEALFVQIERIQEIFLLLSFRNIDKYVPIAFDSRTCYHLQNKKAKFEYELNC